MEDYEEVWQKTKSVILPSYLPPKDYQETASKAAIRSNENVINDVLHENLIPALLTEEIQKVCLVRILFIVHV